MKIHWFSPLPPAKTGIALCTEALLPALRERADVTVWTDQQEWNSQLDQLVHVRRFDPENPPWTDLNKADLTFYNIGNNSRFHKGTWEISRRHAGFVILHDLCLQHFFADLYLNQWKDIEGYRQAMELCYGASGRLAADRFIAQLSPIEQLSAEFPLTPLALQNALGVVIHNRTGLQSLASVQLPAVYLPLPYSSGPVSDPSGRPFPHNPGPPYQIITFGFMGPNRRLEPFLEAWASMPEKAAFRLRICGQLWNKPGIESRVRELRLEALVELCGYLSDEDLARELARSHLAVNLRFPTMGEASLTQLMIWTHALPALVTDTGWYATLPTTTVAFVRPDHERDDICRHLQAFLQDPRTFATMGREGYRTLQRQHTPDTYAKALVTISDNVHRWNLRRSRLFMAERAGSDLMQWIAPAATQALTGNLARAIWDITGDDTDNTEASARLLGSGIDGST
jgi:glycosyltransferase involved in cell wall biosynthesis